ncbi:MAG: hypothetical protein R3C11_04740 [Planctomycetaceae bacterium]
MTTVGLTTGEGGKLKDIVDIPLTLPSNHMGHLEDSFFIMTHVRATPLWKWTEPRQAATSCSQTRSEKSCQANLSYTGSLFCRCYSVDRRSDYGDNFAHSLPPTDRQSRLF